MKYDVTWSSITREAISLDSLCDTIVQVNLNSKKKKKERSLIYAGSPEIVLPNKNKGLNTHVRADPFISLLCLFLYTSFFSIMINFVFLLVAFISAVCCLNFGDACDSSPIYSQVYLL